MPHISQGMDLCQMRTGILIGLIATIVLVGGGLGIYFAFEDDSSSSKTSTESTVSAATTVETLTTSLTQNDPCKYIYIGTVPNDSLIQDLNNCSSVKGTFQLLSFNIPSSLVFENLLSINRFLEIKQVNINYENAFPKLRKIGDDLKIRHSYPNSLSNAFPNLTEIGNYQDYWSLDITLDSSTSLDNAFPELEKIGSLWNNDSLTLSLYIKGDQLESLGTAFQSLRRIPGVIAFGSTITNFTALDNLECHGGIYNNSDKPSINYCEHCPSSLIQKSFCCGNENEMSCDDCDNKVCRGNNVPPKQLDTLCLCCEENQGYFKKADDQWECVNCDDVSKALDSQSGECKEMPK